MTVAILVIVTIVCIAAIFFYGMEAGKRSVKLETQEDIIDDVHIVKAARDAISSRSSMRDKLRAKYTRK